MIRFIIIFGVMVLGFVAVIVQIRELYPTQQPYAVTAEALHINHPRIFQHTLLKTDPAQQTRLLALGSMIFEVLAEITLIASLRYRVLHARQLHLFQLTKFFYDLVVAFLRHVFHPILFLI